MLHIDTGRSEPAALEDKFRRRHNPVFVCDAAQSRLRRSLCIREAQKNVLISHLPAPARCQTLASVSPSVKLVKKQKGIAPTNHRVLNNQMSCCTCAEGRARGYHHNLLITEP